MFASTYIRQLFPSLLFGTSHHRKAAVKYRWQLFQHKMEKTYCKQSYILLIMFIFVFIYLSVVHKYVTMISTIPIWYRYNTLKHKNKVVLPKNAAHSSEENMMYNMIHLALRHIPHFRLYLCHSLNRWICPNSINKTWSKVYDSTTSL